MWRAEPPRREHRFQSLQFLCRFFPYYNSTTIATPPHPHPPSSPSPAPHHNITLMDWTLDWSKRRHRLGCIMLDWRLTEANGSDRVTPIRPMATVLVKGRWGRIPSEADMQLGAPCVGIHPCSVCVCWGREKAGEPRWCFALIMC